jgi:translation initiation factor IF-2
LRRFKDDVNEVRTGFECGLSVSNFADIKTGDILECFKMERVAPVAANLDSRINMQASVEANRN